MEFEEQPPTDKGGGKKMLALDLTNKRFGKLIAVEKVGKNKARNNICLKTLMDCIATSKSRITDAEWERLCEGYRNITGEDYAI